MKVLTEKCETCGDLFQDEEVYAAHINDHRLIVTSNSMFPPIKDEECKFVNGGWNVQRSKEWLEKYKLHITRIVNIEGPPPYSYGWYRTLDDGGSSFYPLACRVLNICPKCFREWGQPYYANNCDCKNKVKS